MTSESEVGQPATSSLHFPPGFLWGTATASHQVEGNNTNNQWWAFEQK
ncbi:MAG: glycosyl hydrolase family protein, partial [Gammaproteobacteria bacterium]